MHMYLMLYSIEVAVVLSYKIICALGRDMQMLLYSLAVIRINIELSNASL